MLSFQAPLIDEVETVIEERVVGGNWDSGQGNYRRDEGRLGFRWSFGLWVRLGLFRRGGSQDEVRFKMSKDARPRFGLVSRAVGSLLLRGESGSTE